jgi:glycosyltransferase involved in cell wall biosynthesis
MLRYVALACHAMPADHHRLVRVPKENGIIIPVKDEKLLLEAMTDVMENQAMYNHLKSNARTMIVNRFEQRVVWDALLNEYQKVK